MWFRQQNGRQRRFVYVFPEYVRNRVPDPLRFPRRDNHPYSWLLLLFAPKCFRSHVEVDTIPYFGAGQVRRFEILWSLGLVTSLKSYGFPTVDWTIIQNQLIVRMSRFYTTSCLWNTIIRLSTNVYWIYVCSIYHRIPLGIDSSNLKKGSEYCLQYAKFDGVQLNTGIKTYNFSSWQ